MKMGIIGVVVAVFTSITLYRSARYLLTRDNWMLRARGALIRMYLVAVLVQSVTNNRLGDRTGTFLLALMGIWAVAGSVTAGASHKQKPAQLSLAVPRSR